MAVNSLHLVFTSPAAGSAFADALRAAAPGDAVLLLQDGAYAAVAGAAWSDALAAAGNVRLHALAADVAARGIVARLHPAVSTVDDDGFVALTEHHARVVSWF